MNQNHDWMDYAPRWSDRVRRIGRKLKELKYDIRALLFPYNAIKVQKLPRTWVDRNEVLFHVMFQILVDYIEQEHIFVDWDIRYETKGRFTDLIHMQKFVEDNYSAEARLGRPPHEANWAAETYKVSQELLMMYEWYKTDKWEIDYSGDLYDFSVEKAANKVRSQMMHRLVELRDHLWS